MRKFSGEIILASSSSRRRELLRELGLKFRIMVPEIDEGSEEFYPGLTQKLASKKALAVASRVAPGNLVIAADTLVVQGRVIFGKPKDRDDARRMLLELSGKKHEVFTGLCLLVSGTAECLSAEERTVVSFRTLSAAEIEAYLDTGEPFDKAGAYGIQGIGRLLVERVEGCFFNVVGLPIGRLNDFFQELGLNLLEMQSEGIY
ncbi:MAG: Maf family protein [Candidatus Wallbacteria bacterium]|nr:Maf family protein [Candidatus Wallbacteria bacterium]